MKMDSVRFSILYKSHESKGTPLSDGKKDCKVASKLRKNLSGKTLSKINSEFSEYILFLLNEGSQFSQQEKNEIVQETTDYYELQSGNQIPNMFLTALADFLLDEELSNQHTSKVQNAEYPVLSFRQLARRKSKQIPVEADTLVYLDNRINHNFAQKRNTSEPSENA